MISIVVGSWGSYTECNERALGSKWLDLSAYNDWEELVSNYGYRWDDDIILYPKMDFEDLAYHMIHEVCCYEIPSYIENYIDYEAYGRDLRFDGFEEYSDGIIEIRR